tara:strand:- start:85 stop:426 length:342 start_codon:yes stop_codon:yes gene_type:complete
MKDIFCTRCGSKQEDNDYCSKCGVKLFDNEYKSNPQNLNELNKNLILKSKKSTKINIQEKKEPQFFDFRLSTILGIPSGIIAYFWLQESGYGWISACILIIILVFAFWPAKNI